MDDNRDIIEENIYYDCNTLSTTSIRQTKEKQTDVKSKQNLDEPEGKLDVTEIKMEIVEHELEDDKYDKLEQDCVEVGSKVKMEINENMLLAEPTCQTEEVFDVEELIFVCKYCSQIFTEEKDLNNHEIINHGTITQNKCMICEMSFPSLILLRKHRVEVHNNKSKRYSKPYTEKPKQLLTEVVENSAKCNFCSEILPIRGGSSCNLKRHIRSKHPEVDIEQLSLGKQDLYNSFQTCVDPLTYESDSLSSSNEASNLQTLFESIDPLFETNLSEKLCMEINCILVELMVKHYLPFQLVDSSNFRKFCNILNPSYELPSKKAISKILLPQLYNMTKEKVVNILDSVGTVCITIDRWTSINTENFMSITAHFINKENKMNRILLDCHKYEENASVLNLSEDLVNVCKQWNLSQKIVAVVTDNCPNIVAAVRRTNWNHVYCFAHTLNLIIQSSLVHIGEIHQKVRKIIDFFQRDSEALEKLKIMQTLLKQPELSLKQDVERNWISTFNMLKSIINIKDSLMSTITLNHLQIDNITEDDIHIIQKCCDIFEVFKDVINEISREMQVTSSKIILIINALINFCIKFLKNNMDLPSSVINFINILLEKLNENFENIEGDTIFSQATFLDPRFKKQGFSNTNYFHETKENIENLISVTSHENESSEQKVIQVKKTNSSKLWMDFDESISALVSSDNRKYISSVEVEKYLAELLLERSMDPLEWWECRKTIYPRLYVLARQRLSVVVCFLPSERFFSKAGQMLVGRRNCLTGNKVSNFLFLSENM